MSYNHDIALLNELNKNNQFINNTINIKLSISNAYLSLAIKYLSEAIQEKYKEEIISLEDILSDLE